LNWNIKRISDQNHIEKFNGVDFSKTLVIIRIFYTFVTVKYNTCLKRNLQGQETFFKKAFLNYQGQKTTKINFIHYESIFEEFNTYL
jgi:hypothetical protein